MKEIIDSFVANGGQIWACGSCAKPRGITDAHLIPGARIVTAAMVVEAMVTGASTPGVLRRHQSCSVAILSEGEMVANTSVQRGHHAGRLADARRHL